MSPRTFVAVLIVVAVIAAAAIVMHRGRGPDRTLPTPVYGHR